MDKSQAEALVCDYAAQLQIDCPKVGWFTDENPLGITGQTGMCLNTSLLDAELEVVEFVLAHETAHAHAWGPSDLRRVFLTCESICRFSLLCCRLAQNPRTLTGRGR